MSFPASLTTRTVKGRFVTYPGGNPAKGSVRIILNDLMQGPSDGTFVAPFVFSAALDSNGEFSVLLPATNDPQWTPSYYRAVITIGDKTNRYKFQVPFHETSDIDLAEVLNVPPPSPGETYIFVSTKGAPGGVASLDSTGKVPSSQLPGAAGGTVVWDDVEDKPEVFPHDEVTYGQVTEKPSTFPPSAHDHDYDSITDKPGTFPPSSHEHSQDDVAGLGDVLAAKAPTASPTFTGTVSGVTAAMVGLGNVANTTDASKPVSTAQQEALNLKANVASPTFTGTPAAPTATSGNNTTQLATTAFVATAVSPKADASAVTTALGAKADLVNGVIPTSQMPSLSINDTFEVTSQAAMLALTAQRGDVAVRTDLTPNRLFFLIADAPGTLANWKEITAAGSVLTINGQSGNVILVKGDLGLGNVANTAPADLPLSDAATSALNNKANLVSGKVAASEIPDFANAWSLFPTVKDTQYSGGAKGDGTTEDTAAINAAIAAAKTAKIGMVLFPSGVYIAQNLILSTGIHFWGMGAGGDIYSNVDAQLPHRGTVLKLKSGANVDLIRTENFDTLTGQTTPSAYLTPSRFGIHNMVLDGNRNNNTSGWPLRIFGRTYTIENVYIQNGASGGAYSEWGAGGYEMEARWSNFTITDNSGIGLDWHGPHDSQFSNGYVARNDGHVGVRLGTGVGVAGGEMFSNVHVWGNHTYQWVIATGNGMFSNCVADGTNGVQFLTGGHQWNGGNIYGSNTPGEVAITIGDGTVRPEISGINVDTRIHNYAKGSAAVRLWPDSANTRNRFRLSAKMGGNVRYFVSGKSKTVGAITLPVTSIVVEDATSFSTSGGSLYLSDGTNIATPSYTGVSGNTLTGVTGGTGTFAGGSPMFSVANSIAGSDYDIVDVDNGAGGVFSTHQTSRVSQFLSPTTYNVGVQTLRPNTSATAYQQVRNETSRVDLNWDNSGSVGAYSYQNGATVEGRSGTSSGTRTWKLDSATGALQVNGVSVALAAKTSAYTLTTSDSVITADATTAAFSVTLPTAVGNTGKTYTIKRTNTNANAVTVATTSSQTIDGATTYVLTMPQSSVEVISDGAGWRVLNALSDTSKAVLLVPFVNVRAFGALVDGVTDDSAAWNAAVTALVAVGGGTLAIPPGILIGSALRIAQGVSYVGSGRGSTTIKLKSGSNTSLLITDNFATLTGTNSTGGPNRWAIRDLTLDANKAGQTSGTSYALCIYGYDFDIDKITVKNARTQGIYSEWGTAGIITPDSMESVLRDVKVHDNDGGGILWRGPHDSLWDRVIAWYNGPAAGAGGYGFYFDSSANYSGVGHLLRNCHVFGPHVNGIICNDVVWSLGSISEGADNAQVVLLKAYSEWRGGNIFSPYSGNAAIGIQLGDATNNPDHVYVDTVAQNCNGGALNIVATNGNNRIVIRGSQLSGPSRIGVAPTSTDDIQIYPAVGSTGVLSDGYLVSSYSASVYGALNAIVPYTLGDSYKRADNAGSVGTADYSIGAYFSIVNTTGILDNAAYTPSGTGMVVTDWGTGSADGYCEILISTFDTSVSLIGRYNSSTGYYELRMNTGGAELFWVVSGTRNKVGDALYGGFKGTGSRLGLLMNGSSVQPCINGVPVGNAYVSSNNTTSASGSCGWRTQTSAARVKNLIARKLVNNA